MKLCELWPAGAPLADNHANTMSFDRNKPGGTDGGAGSFLVGVALLAGGLWLVFSRVVVHGGHFFGGYMGGMMGGAAHGGAVAVILLPFIAGIALLFTSAKSRLGWGLLAVAIVLLCANIVMSLDIYFQPTSLPTFLAMFAFVAAGLGLIIKGLLTGRAR